MKGRFSFSLVLACVLLAVFLVTPASARDWTDAQGNRFEAIFLRFEGENAVLLRSGEVITLPLRELSKADLRYLRRDLELAGLGHLVPPVGSTAPDDETAHHDPAPTRRPSPPARPAQDADSAPDASDNRRVLADQPLRAWTDAQGRKINAKLLEIRDDGVVLMMNGEKFTVPFSRLSRSDQRYVERLERESASADRVAEATEGEAPTGFPTPPPSVPNAPVFDPPPIDAARVEEHARRAEERMEEIHAGMQEEARRREDEARRQAESMEEFARNVAEQAGANESFPPAFENDSPPESSPDYPDPPHDAVAANVPSRSGAAAPPGYSPPPPSFREPPPLEPEIPATAFPTGPSMGEVGLCSNCNKEVPAHIGAGQRCPHCGVYFEYEESESGQRTYAKGGGSSNVHISGRGVRGLIKIGVFVVFALLGFFGWLGRKLLGES